MFYNVFFDFFASTYEDVDGSALCAEYVSSESEESFDHAVRFVIEKAKSLRAKGKYPDRLNPAFKMLSLSSIANIELIYRLYFCIEESDLAEIVGQQRNEIASRRKASRRAYSLGPVGSKKNEWVIRLIEDGLKVLTPDYSTSLSYFDRKRGFARRKRLILVLLALMPLLALAVWWFVVCYAQAHHTHPSPQQIALVFYLLS